MANKTPDEVYEYVHDYKSKLRDEYNQDQEKLFDTSNKIKLENSKQQTLFSSVLISVGSGYLLTNPTPGLCIKILLIGALFTFVISVIAGLYGIHSASEFWLKWARHAYEKGGMVYKDNSKTVEQLDDLLKKIEKKNADMPMSNSNIPSIVQTTFFLFGIMLVLSALSVAAIYR